MLSFITNPSFSPAWILLPVAADFLMTIFAVVIDFASGIRAARRASLPLSSSGFRRTVGKLSAYLLTLFALLMVDALIIMAALFLRADMGWTLPVFPFVTTAGALCICIIEVKSVVENCHGPVKVRDIISSAASAATDAELRRLIDALKEIIGKDVSPL